MTEPTPDPDFARADEMPDELFYSMPRLVRHIDDPACAALASFYSGILNDGDQVLDLMSSCVSHLPETLRLGRVVGHGMNATELEANPQLDEFFIQNLNRSSALPLGDGIFDACLIAVSAQYLVQPVAVFKEVARILRPGGIFAISYSNRMFPTKAVRIWQQNDAAGHGKLLEDYLAQSGGFAAATISDISPLPGRSDPLNVVTAVKLQP